MGNGQSPIVIREVSNWCFVVPASSLASD